MPEELGLDRRQGSGTLVGGRRLAVPAQPPKQISPGGMEQVIVVQIHRARNVLAKVSAHDHGEVRADYWAIFDVGDAQPGDAAVVVARAQAEAFAARWQRPLPKG